MNIGKQFGTKCKWLHIAVATCVILSCSPYDGNAGDEESVSVPMVLKIDTGNGIENMEEESTAGVFVIDKEKGETVRKNEMLIVGKDGMLMQECSEVVPSEIEMYDFFAYSPYKDGWDDVMDSVIEFDVCADQSLRQCHVDSDLMLAHRIDRKDGYVETVFGHAMTKIMVHVTDRTGVYDMRFSSLSLAGLKLRSYIYMVEGTCVTDDQVKGDVLCYPKENINRRASFAAVVPPQEIADRKLNMTIGIGDYRYEFTVADVDPLIGGKLQVFNIRMTERGLEFEGTDVTDWEDAGGGNMTVAFE